MIYVALLYRIKSPRVATAARLVIAEDMPVVRSRLASGAHLLLPRRRRRHIRAFEDPKCIRLKQACHVAKCGANYGGRAAEAYARPIMPTGRSHGGHSWVVTGK